MYVSQKWCKIGTWLLWKADRNSNAHHQIFTRRSLIITDELFVIRKVILKSFRNARL